MRRFLCFVMPPLAVLFCGKPFSAFFNLLMTCLFWVPGVIHANLVLTDHLQNGNANRVVKAIKAVPRAIVEQRPRGMRAELRNVKVASFIDDPATGAKGHKFRRRTS